MLQIIVNNNLSENIDMLDRRQIIHILESSIKEQLSLDADFTKCTWKFDKNVTVEINLEDK